MKTNAQTTDTLENVKVFSKKQLDVTATAVNVQQLNKTELSKLNSLSVADAVKYFSGVIVKDYGGIGGLKTISVRSLGANHTAVMYDGIVLGDAQGGQTDLGKLSLDNIESIQLFSNQPVDILLPARSYASASVLALSSSSNSIEERSVSIKLKGGSFGFFNPAVSFKTATGKKLSHGLSAEYQSADGSYSFINYVSGTGKARRNNADVQSYRVEYNTTYQANDSNKLKARLYYYNSKRGLPGAVILYNSFSNQRLNNENFFGQLTWQKSFSARSRLLVSSKFSTDYKYYLDPNYLGNADTLENQFRQRELYFSAAYSYKLTPSVSLAYSSDYFYSKLKQTGRTTQLYANPNRNNFLNNLSIWFKRSRFDVNANLLYTIINEHVENGLAANKLSKFTTAIATSVQPFQNNPLRVRASYKAIFRAPTFDDLYYTNVGNAGLRPEYVKQYSAGLTYNYEPGKFIKDILLTTDFYYSNVKDKILAVPRQNLFQWTMLNVGKVDIKGIDIAARINLKKWKALNIAAHVSYSFQDAKNVDANSLSYKQQLPYIPKHSGSAGLNITYGNAELNYNALMSSYRYRLGDQIPENLVKEWATQDISLAYNYEGRKRQSYKFIAELNNVFNKQYDIIKYYPMPRFNYRIAVIVTFKKL